MLSERKEKFYENRTQFQVSLELGEVAFSGNSVIFRLLVLNVTDSWLNGAEMVSCKIILQAVQRSTIFNLIICVYSVLGFDFVHHSTIVFVVFLCVFIDLRSFAIQHFVHLSNARAYRIIRERPRTRASFSTTVICIRST